jgi:putative ABC transport system ATP-binding protein/lipoprotein-releasing system ATP-binding protein
MVLAGLIPAAAGSIIIDGVETAGFSAQRWAAVRLAKLGIIYQFGELLPELNPVENVILPALLAGSDPKSARAHAAGLLQALQVGATERMNTATLSGGERQRVAAARALINRPAVLLADEPTGALDATTADIVAELLFSLPKQYGCGVVVVTHNPQVADRADVQLSLNAGKLRQAIR